MFKVIAIPAFQDNYIWLMVNTQNHQACVVDPGDANPVLSYLADSPYTLCAILITHHHWDHSGGIQRLRQQWPVPVYGPATENIKGIDHPITDGDQVELASMGANFQIFHIPGHTLGHIAFFGQGLLFAGDTLFTAGCGRLFEGTAQQMYDSLQTLAQLPDNTLLYCGHEYTLSNLAFAAAVEPQNEAIQERIKQCQQLRQANFPTVPATLALEKQTNPFLRTHHDSVKQAAEKITGQQQENPVQILSTIREWKDRF